MNYDNNEYNYQRRRDYERTEPVYTDDEVVSIGNWILVLIILAIPIINIIALLVLAFGSDNENLKNFGKASLVLAVIALFLGVLIGACS